MVPVMRQGRRVAGLPTLNDARAHAARQLAALPADLSRLGTARYSVTISPALISLAEACDRRMEAYGSSRASSSPHDT